MISRDTNGDNVRLGVVVGTSNDCKNVKISRVKHKRHSAAMRQTLRLLNKTYSEPHE